MKLIYFAHSVNDYNTEYEQELIKIIRRMFNERIKIMNPKNIKSPKSTSLGNAYVILRDYFFPIIKKCNVFIYVTNKNGNLTFGVIKELEYAKDIEIEIISLNRM